MVDARRGATAVSPAVVRARNDANAGGSIAHTYIAVSIRRPGVQRTSSIVRDTYRSRRGRWTRAKYLRSDARKEALFGLRRCSVRLWRRDYDRLGLGRIAVRILNEIHVHLVQLGGRYHRGVQPRARGATDETDRSQVDHSRYYYCSY